MKSSLYPLAVCLLLGVAHALAADEAESPEADGDAPTEEKAEKKPKTIEELTENSDRIDGLLTLFRDRKTGDVRILLHPDQLDKDLLYFSYAENGVAEAGWLTRGAYRVGPAKLFRIRRFFNRVEFVELNTSYHIDPRHPLHRAADANISHAVIFDEKIESEDEASGSILIKANGLFLTESLNPIAPLPAPDKKAHEIFGLGKLSKTKSKIRSIRNYPENTDLIVEYVYENDKPYVRGSEAITDPRSISIVIQHSLLKAPADPMEPRFDDPRVGYFTHQITDLTSNDITPYRDVISRWRLEKKDPSAALSEPVKPITFWIENTTPLELRPIIRDAGLRWNEAFEQAGFKNAVRIEIQPDDAEWDAGDVRYNVIRWVASPRPRYSGYGPSFQDPRTGENLGADIMLENVVISRQLHESDLIEEPAAFAADHRHAGCAAGMRARNETLFALAALDAIGADTEAKQRLLEEFIHFLTLHEIGHTLGLNHNFRASYLHSFDQIFDGDVTYPSGLYGSVMDYPAVVLSGQNDKPSQFWSTRPGPYDRWAIEFGYSTAAEDEKAESERLKSLLDRSTEPALAFANDADDMRHPGKAIDPRAMIGDMTDDPIAFARHQVSLINRIIPDLERRLIKEGDSYQYLKNGYYLALYRYQEAVTAASRFIGGVYVDRAMAGQPGATEPLQPVPFSEQARALRLLDEALFAPTAFAAFDGVADKLLSQRRGFDHFERTEDPKLHHRALELQRSILDHLLHPRVLARLTDTSLYGNEYTIDRFLTDLTNTVFDADLKGPVNTFRQNLQLEYVDRLLSVLDQEKYDPIAQSMALNRLRWIESNASPKGRSDLLTAAHREHLRHKIKVGLEPVAAR